MWQTIQLPKEIRRVSSVRRHRNQKETKAMILVAGPGVTLSVLTCAKMRKTTLNVTLGA
jgi:hypothetical protein